MNDRILKMIEATGTAVLENVPLSSYTSFRIGGPARYLAEPSSAEMAADLLRILYEENVPFELLGNGTNVLVSDAGYDGVIVRFGEKLQDIKTEGNKITAAAGTPLTRIAQTAAKAGLAGLAFASGIPGSFGGACFMNAGAYGGEMADVLREVTVLRKDGTAARLDRDGFSLRYRGSSFADNGEVVLSGVMELVPGDREEILREMEDLNGRRREKQPLNYPSAGSTFKRPEGHFAGKLISDAGLKGLRVGGAEVSEKHAGFIINAGGATAADVRELIRLVQERVLAESGVALETEVRFIGAF